MEENKSKNIQWLQELLRTTPSLPSVNGNFQIDGMSVASNAVRNKSALSRTMPTPPIEREHQPFSPPAAGCVPKRPDSTRRHWLTWQGTPKPSSSVDNGWVDEIVTPAPGASPYGNTTFKPSFGPALKAWINGANEGEREVALNLFHHLNNSMPVQTTNNGRPVRQFPGRYKGQKGAIWPQPLGGRGQLNKKYREPTAGVRTRPFSSIDETQINEHLNRVALTMETPQPVLDGYTGDPTMWNPEYGQQGPVRMSSKKNNDGFVCEQSHFMNSQLPYRSHFIINPEWVSEAKMMKKLALSAAKKRRSVSAKY